MSVGDAIRAFLRRYQLEDKFHEERVAVVCREVIGPELIRWVKNITYKRGVLQIEVSSAAVRQELGYHRTAIREEVNRHFDKEMVQQVNIN